MNLDSEFSHRTPPRDFTIAGPAVARPSSTLAGEPPAAVPLPPPALSRAGALPLSGPAAVSPTAAEPVPADAFGGSTTEPLPSEIPVVETSTDLAWLDALDWSMEDEPAAPPVPVPAVPTPAESAPSHPSVREAPAAAAQAEPAASEDDGALPPWMAWVSDDSDAAAAFAFAPGDTEQPLNDAGELPIAEIDTLLDDEQDDAPWAAALPESDPWSSGEPEPSAVMVPDEPVAFTMDEAEVEEAGGGSGEWDEPQAAVADGVEDRGESSPTSEHAPAAEPEVMQVAPAGAESAAEPVAHEVVPIAATEIVGAASDALGEVADRLERIAASLRSRSSADLLSGADSRDPLELLLTGFVLGYASRSNAAPKSDRDD